MSAETIRYVVTHLDKNGMRTLAEPMQGRYTYPTYEDAEQVRKDFLAANSEARLKSVFGLPLEVRPVACWPNHFDPKTCWFDDVEGEPGG